MNLSHGSFFMLTGYLLLWFMKFFYDFLWLSVLLSIIIVTTIGGLAYILLIKPLQETSVGVVLITFGLAFAIEQYVLIISGTDSYAINRYLLVQGFTEIFGYRMINQFILLIFASLIIVLTFALFINKSKLGKSIRAVSQDREAATLMGINSNRILLYTVMISAFLASIAGFLYLPAAALSGPSMGFASLTSAFAVVILGGMGSLIGSVVGSYIVGFINSFTINFIPNGPSWAHLIPIIIIIIMLIIRPQGLFGKKEVM